MDVIFRFFETCYRPRDHRGRFVRGIYFVRGEVVALFPYTVVDPQGHIMSYAHVGQHGAADYEYIMGGSRPATPAEYDSLLQELYGIGYEDLHIIEKRDPERYARARKVKEAQKGAW